MRVEKMCKQRIFPALVAIFMMLCLSGVGVVWQYVDSSSDSQNAQPSLSAAASASDVKGKAPSTDSSFANGGGLWSWGGSPRGFSVTNGTLKYPDDYYTSHFNLGYNKSEPSYGQNKLQNLSQYSTGFATGFIRIIPDIISIAFFLMGSPAMIPGITILDMIRITHMDIPAPEDRPFCLCFFIRSDVIGSRLCFT